MVVAAVVIVVVTVAVAAAVAVPSVSSAMLVTEALSVELQWLVRRQPEVYQY